MKILGLGILGVLLVASCGGESEGGAQDESVTGDDDSGDDDSGESDDDSGDDDDADDDDSDDDSGDDDSDDDSGDDDATDDDADDDDSGDDDSGDDDVSVMPTATGMPTVMPPGPGPTPTMTPGVDPPLEGCQIASQSQGQGYCDLQEQCADGIWKSSYCSQLANGNWGCSCSGASGSWELELTADAAPCGDVSALCDTISDPMFGAEETCEPTLQSQAADYCEQQVRCTKSAPLSDGVNVVQSNYQYAYCYQYGDTLSCNCNSNTASKSFSLASVALTGACDVGMDLCSADAVIEPVGEPTCMLNGESAGTGYCQRQETCTETVTVNGTEVALTSPKSSTCQTDATGVTICTCYNNSQGYTFEYAAAADAAGTCASAVSVCDSTEEPVPQGEIECGVTNQSASGSYCSASLQCTQDAALGDVTVDLSGYLYTSCQPSGDSWSCQCQGTSEVATVTVEAENAFGACTEAVEQCPDLVEVEVTSQGGGRPCVYFAQGSAAAPADVAAPAPAPGIGVPVPPCYR